MIIDLSATLTPQTLESTKCPLLGGKIDTGDLGTRCAQSIWRFPLSSVPQLPSPGLLSASGQRPAISLLEESLKALLGFCLEREGFLVRDFNPRSRVLIFQPQVHAFLRVVLRLYNLQPSAGVSSQHFSSLWFFVAFGFLFLEASSLCELGCCRS